MHTKCSTKTVQRAGWEQSGGGIAGLQRHCMYIARPWRGGRMSNQPQGKKAHYKQLGPITKSLDRGRGRGRGHRAALAIWFTALVRGPGWTIDFGNSNSNSNKQQATSNKQQATSNKQQATSNKQQATSNKQQATSNSNKQQQQATATSNSRWA